MVRRLVRLTVSATVFLLLILTFSTSYAALGVGLTFTPACNGYTVRGGSITSDRDNTGRGFEALVIVARDGAGTIIYESQAAYPVNQRITLTDGDYVNWTAVPQFNPIIMQVVSPGGNGQPDQLIYAVSGNCAELPTYGDGSFSLSDLSFVPLLTVVPPSAPGGFDPNAAPPRPVNPPGLAQQQPGYAVVAVDNLNLRSGDSAQYTALAILDGGTELIVRGSNGKQTGDLWWYVEVGGLRGWVSSQHLHLRGDLSGVPVEPVSGMLIPPTLYVGASNPVYNTPSSFGRTLCEIPGNRFYVIAARDSAIEQWYRVEATCDGQVVLGWIRTNRGILRNPARSIIPVA